MKRVLLIADSNMSLSGVPVVCMSIVRSLKENYIFDIIVLKDNDMYFEEEFLSYGGNIFRFNCKKPDNFIKKLFWLIHSYPKAVKEFLKNKIDLNQYDVIHSFYEGFSYPFIKAAKKAGIEKRILHICSAKSAYPAKKTLSQLLFDWYQRKAMKECTSIVFVSQQSLQLNNYKSKGVVLYNMYDEKKFDNIIDCKSNNLSLTQIATFSIRKNQLFSLKLLKLLKEKIPNVQLNIMGKELEEGYLEKMNLFISQNNLKDNVTFYEGSFDRVELNEKTSYIIYPSIMESFGLVLIESQACGIHCFANKDIPNDADMGNVDFLELNPELWTEKIYDYYTTFGNARKKPVNKDKFSSEQFIKKLKSIY